MNIFSLIPGILTAFENVLAQEDAINSEGTVNDRMLGENAIKLACNLAFVQEGLPTEYLV